MEDNEHLKNNNVSNVDNYIDNDSSHESMLDEEAAKLLTDSSVNIKITNKEVINLHRVNSKEDISKNDYFI